VRVFKHLLLKVLDTLPDNDVVERSRYAMSYKYFLGMTPEESVIDASSLTKFRKLRIKDSTLLDTLIGKTVQVALEKGIIKDTPIIADSTHAKARYTKRSTVETLREQSKRLRKAVYDIDASMRERFPAKTSGEDVEMEIAYRRELLDVIAKDAVISEYPTVKTKVNLLSETIEDDLEHLGQGSDPDTRTGHKSSDSSFFGYKTHLAMTEERIITAAVVTSGEKSDGKQLVTLVEKSIEAGITVDTVVGDMAYSEKGNIEYAEDQNIRLMAKLNPCISQGFRKREDEFDDNKYACMYVCKAGHMAFRKAAQGRKNQGQNQTVTYYFNTARCRACSMSEGCYTKGAKSKTYSVIIKSDAHGAQAEFQDTEFFKMKGKERCRIEARNSELKNRQGYATVIASGLANMELQGAVSILAVNFKRIVALRG